MSPDLRRQLRQAVADAAAASQPPAPGQDAAEARQQAAWRAVTAVAAADGMDPAWFRTCLEALGLLPYEHGSRYHYGACGRPS
jgi:hypothetical protein